MNVNVVERGILRPARGLTRRQREILRFIAGRLAAGSPATIRDIGERFGIGSPNGVVCHLRSLERKGYIERVSVLSRSIRLVGCELLLRYTPDAAGVRLKETLEGGDAT